MKRVLVGIAALAVAGIISACGGTSTGAAGEEEQLGALHLALNGELDATLAVIAIQNIFDRDENYLLECARKPHTWEGQYFCDELQVLPPGVYEIRVQSPDPDCEVEEDHYKALVEPGLTSEITINLICGIDNGALDTIVKETHRPVVEDISFEFGLNGPANKFMCNYLEDPTLYDLVEVNVELSDLDTACEDLEVTFTADPATLVFTTTQPRLVGDACIATLTVDPELSPVDDYMVTIEVVDDGVDDPYTTEFSFPIHVIECSLAP